MSNFSSATRAAIGFAAELIEQARHVVILTGAGLSTPSGIPDFRSEGSGLWARDEPLEVASQTTFRTAPEKFFNWFRPLAGQIYHAEPNAAHYALAALEKNGRLQTILTQNIDMLHQKAGAQNVVELHGTLRTLSCTQCYQQVSCEPYLPPFLEYGTVPHCPHCRALLKPDVILFGEQLPQKAILKAQQECRKCDLMIVAGSSLEVLPVAGLPMQAIDHGAHLVILNQAFTYINPRADIVLNENTAEVIPAIVERVLYGQHN
jgi:NAD-dependent deacetylase